MTDWRELVKAGDYAEAEAAVLEATEPFDPYGDNTVARAEFYEAWGDSLVSHSEAIDKYGEADRYFSLFASWSTSGGEGTARMTDVKRVRAKIETLKGR
jgi:hypothetical protein